jgi:stigma-specific protein Stig1
MTNHWDEFTKSLVEKSVPRRETLRLFGAALAGALLGTLGAGKAWAASDPCKSFCRCRTKKQQNACLAACRTCSGDTSRLCGSCGSGYVCTDLASDFDNCGACGAACAYPGPYEDGACVDGQCFYSCVEGATDCGGTCTDLGTDPNNCGECGNVCPASAPVCVAGACIASTCTPSCPEGWCGGDGCGGVCACPSGMYCEYDGWCYNGCVFPYILCGGVCVDPWSDSSNCGACGNVCPSGLVCSSGACWDPMCQFYDC